MELQSAKYAAGVPERVSAPVRPLPFLYESTGVETRFIKGLDPDLTPEMLTRSTWEREHRAKLDRLDILDRHIDLSQRLEHLAVRELQRRLERDFGIEL